MASQATDRVETESLQDQVRDIQQEARMVLPGLQVLFGFQLVAVFNSRFTELDRMDRMVHLAALLLITFAIGLIMTPAALHRISERGTVSSYLVRIASNLIAIAMVPLLVGISLDVYVVSRLATDATIGWPSILLAGAVLTTLAALWLAFPLWRRARPAIRDRRSSAAAQTLPELVVPRLKSARNSAPADADEPRRSKAHPRGSGTE